jgi:hypothetical protein
LQVSAILRSNRGCNALENNIPCGIREYWEELSLSREQELYAVLAGIVGDICSLAFTSEVHKKNAEFEKGST